MERSELSKPLVITYPDVSHGFSLTGIDVKEVQKDEDITPIIQGIAEGSEYGLLIIEEKLLAKVDGAVLKRIGKKGIPVIVPIDTPRTWHGEIEMEAYIARLIRKAIGYQVKIKR